jgi:hypothetical protein
LLLRCGRRRDRHQWRSTSRRHPRSPSRGRACWRRVGEQNVRPAQLTRTPHRPTDNSAPLRPCLLRLLGRTLRTPIVAKAVLYTFIMYAAVPATSSGTFYFWTDQDACRGCDDHGVNHWEGVVLPAPQPPRPGGGDQAAAATAAGDVRVGCEWFRERGQSVGVGDACRAPLAWLNSSGASDALLSSAWDNCPQACAECGVNGRGCIGFSAAFLGATRAVCRPRNRFRPPACLTRVRRAPARTHVSTNNPRTPDLRIPSALLAAQRQEAGVHVHARTHARTHT